MPRSKGSSIRRKAPRSAADDTHPKADLLLRPEVGTPARFKKPTLPQTCRSDSSLRPVPGHDGPNLAREQSEALIRVILDAKDLVVKELEEGW